MYQCIVLAFVLLALSLVRRWPARVCWALAAPPDCENFSSHLPAMTLPYDKSPTSVGAAACRKSLPRMLKRLLSDLVSGQV